MGTIRLRFLVEAPDALLDEYRQCGVECSPNSLRDTPWMTRELGVARNLLLWGHLRTHAPQHITSSLAHRK
jgi:hypothetical protein